MNQDTLRGDAVVRRACPQDGRHYFFGYYDLQGFDETDQQHLCHRVDFRDRMPGRFDTAVLGVVSLADGRFEPVAKTGAFNFQQGAMLQFLPGGEIFYNARTAKGGSNGFCGVVQNLATGQKKVLERPAACLSPNGKQALGLNFARLFDFRPGYGYGGADDPFADTAAPAEDGLFSIDMETGASRLLVSYDALAKQFGLPTDAKILINHVTFSPKGSQFLFLLRTFPREGLRWGTYLAVMEADGSNLRLLAGPAVISHYHWRDETTLLLYTEYEAGQGLYLLDTRANTAAPFARDTVRDDIHCLYSPDRSLVLGDGYPDREGFRPVYLLDAATGRGRVLLSAFSPTPSSVDARCDLHARWNRAGTAFSFDSTHEGETGLYWAEVPKGR